MPVPRFCSIDAKCGEYPATLAEFVNRDNPKQPLGVKYLTLVWSALQKPTELTPLAEIQAEWNKLPGNIRQIEEVQRGCERIRDLIVNRKADDEFKPKEIQWIEKIVVSDKSPKRTCGTPVIGNVKSDVELLRLRAGTIEVSVGAGNHSDIFNVLAGLASPEKHVAKDALNLITGPLVARITAIQGILCGLLDYNIDAVEFADVFRGPIEASESQLLGIHKGTMFQLIMEDRSFDAALPAIGMTPYLLLPQSILLHNEALLVGALKETKKVDTPHPELRLREVELALREVLQRKLLSNVFQYSTEQKLYDVGLQSRGLTELRNSLELRLKEINGRLEEVVSKKEASLAKWLAVFGVVLALGQMVSGWEQLAALLSMLYGVTAEQSRFVVGIVVIPVIVLVPAVVYLVFRGNKHSRG